MTGTEGDPPPVLPSVMPEGSTATANPSGMMTTYRVAGVSPNPPPVMPAGEKLITTCSACGFYRCEGIPETPRCPHCNAEFPYFEPKGN